MCVMRVDSRRLSRGATIIELMVGLVVGLLVILGAIAMYLGASRSGGDIVRLNRFNQDLRAVLDIVVSDLRRSGYNEGAGTSSANPFRNIGTTDIVISGASRECILFAYDTTWRNPSNPGVVNAGTDFGGFRLNNGVVQVLRSSTLASTAADCSTLDWEDLTDTNIIEVTALQFDFGGSTCVSANPDGYNPSDPATFVTWTTSSPTASPACASGAPNAPSGGSFPPSSNAFSEIRRITISLQGRSRAAGVTQAVTRAPLVETIVIRNHWVATP